jgi:hypothetical protein
MQSTRKTEPNGSPVPGVIPEPPHAHDDAAPAAADPAAEREARRPGVMIPRREKRLPFEAPVMRVVATAGIVAIGVVIAAIMGSQDSQAWLIGLVVSLVSLAVAAVLWSSRRL